MKEKKWKPEKTYTLSIRIPLKLLYLIEQRSIKQCKSLNRVILDLVANALTNQ